MIRFWSGRENGDANIQPTVWNSKLEVAMWPTSRHFSPGCVGSCPSRSENPSSLLGHCSLPSYRAGESQVFLLHVFFFLISKAILDQWNICLMFWLSVKNRDWKEILIYRTACPMLILFFNLLGGHGSFWEYDERCGSSPPNAAR